MAAIAAGVSAAPPDVGARTAATCAFTRPNGKLIPGMPAGGWYGNGRLVTSAYGRIVPGPQDVNPNGSISYKFPWWGAPSVGKGLLRIAGRRLDRVAPRLRARIDEGGVEGVPSGTRFWATTLTFPTPGCWRVTGTVGRVRLALTVVVRRPQPPEPPVLRFVPAPA